MTSYCLKLSGVYQHVALLSLLYFNFQLQLVLQPLHVLRQQLVLMLFISLLFLEVLEIRDRQKVPGGALLRLERLVLLAEHFRLLVLEL